jgi:hypothetical protein
MTIVTPTGIVGINSITSLVNDITFSTASGSSLTANGLSFTSINDGPLAGFRNAIINGNFDIWQRGTSFTASNYGVDRWRNNIGGSSTCTMSRQAFTLGQTDVPGEPTYFCRMAVTSVANSASFITLQQRIEGVRTFAGQTVTVSFWAKADASKPIAVELGQNFGTGGSPSSGVTSIGTTKVTLSTSWQKVTVTANVPSISGKTLGTNTDDFLQINIWFDAGSDYNARTDSLGQRSGTFDIAQVQIEPGTVATPFERRPIGQELALCQRYYARSGPGRNIHLSDYNGTNPGRFVADPQWPVRMRATPSVTATFTGGVNPGVSQITADGCHLFSDGGSCFASDGVIVNAEL